MILNAIYVKGMEQEEIYNCYKDDKACNSTSCTTFNALERSGFVCNNFPYYCGGWQLIDYETYWKKDMKTMSQCDILNDTNITSQCTQWQTFSTTHSNMNQTCICNSNNSTIKCQTWQCHSAPNMDNNNYSLPIAECQCTQYNQNISQQTICVEWNCIELYNYHHPNVISVNQTSDFSKVYNASYKCISDEAAINGQSINGPWQCLNWTADKINLGTLNTIRKIDVKYNV